MEDDDESRALVTGNADTNPANYMAYNAERVVPADDDAASIEDLEDESIIRKDDPAIPPPTMDYPVLQIFLFYFLFCFCGLWYYFPEFPWFTVRDARKSFRKKSVSNHGQTNPSHIRSIAKLLGTRLPSLYLASNAVVAAK